MITSFEELHQQVGNRPEKIVALAAADDPVLLQAAAEIQSEGLARFLLVGTAADIQAAMSGIDGNFEIIDSPQPAAEAVRLVREGQADLLMKGRLATSDLLKAVLDRQTGLRQGALLNHIAVIESPSYHKLLFISDGGINLKFDDQIYRQMVANISSYLKRLGNEHPKFGMLALVETVTDKIPETRVARLVVDQLRADYLIEGPIAPDVALSARAAEKKGIDSQIAGDVDVFLMPNTSAANHLVKGLTLLGGCQAGGLIVGARVPVILLSRSDDRETKYRSILLGLV